MPDKPTPRLDEQIDRFKSVHDLFTTRNTKVSKKRLHLVHVDGLVLQEAAMKAFLLAQRDLARKGNKKIVVVSDYRSWAKQAYLYAKWKAGLSSIPAAPPGSSYHNIGLAIDIANWSDPEIRHALISNGWNWGSSFNDDVHFSYRVKG